MKCTIQNIADHLGLSRNTVSKALQNSSEVSENTRNLVIKTASKLGYKNATFATPVIPCLLYTSLILLLSHLSAQPLPVLD